MGYTPITLPNSKEVVLIQPVSPFLLQKLRRRYPPPPIPVQRVNLGTEDSPHWEEEPNEAHPDYIAAREKWKGEVEERVRRLTISLGATIEWTDAKRQRLVQLQKGLLAAGEEGLVDGDDDFVYISYIACQTGEDYRFLVNEIINGSQPTEEAIQEAIATFRPEPNGHSPDLQGQERI